MEKSMPSAKVTLASKIFEVFFAAEKFTEILALHEELCRVLRISPGSPLTSFYPTLKANIRALCAANLFQVLDKKVGNAVYGQQLACAGLKVLVIGCGPCGLRAAIEAQLLGAEAVVLEKRTDFGRNNVLHLWPFVIEDLKMLGVKQFFPKFCTGSMDHISIRRLQTILLKVALLLGVRVYCAIQFCDIIEPLNESKSAGWKVAVSPAGHPVADLIIDALIGAEGKRVTVPGFKRKEFRGKLAIAITANFVNSRTTAEAVVQEISGVAFVYKQDFFNSLYDKLGIALENIVYFKDETHYFVMTTRKHSLLDRQVLKRDLQDPAELLHPDNIDKEALLEYTRDACDFCTDYQLPELQFVTNNHGEPDVAIFDFTSMFAATNSAYVREKFGKQLILSLVGDGLIEPFWPTGSGCARGFLGVLDACWMLSEWWAGQKSVLQILAERESVLRLLAQTTSENVAKDWKSYTVDPSTRYPNLNKFLYGNHQVSHLYWSDQPEKGGIPREEYAAQCSPAQMRPALRPAPVRSHRSQMPDLDDDPYGRVGQALPDFVSKKISEMSASSGRCNNQSMAKPDVYIYNTSKFRDLVNKPESASRRPVSSGGSSSKVDTGRQFNRKEAIDKITETFGYGPVKPAAGPVSGKKPVRSGTSQRRSAPPPVTDSGSSTKTTRSKPVKKFIFQPPIGGNKDDDDLESVIDPELDQMLAQLENDADFQKMSDNEQVAWLESLFYLDPCSRMALGSLQSHRKPRPVSPPRRPVRERVQQHHEVKKPLRPITAQHKRPQMVGTAQQETAERRLPDPDAAGIASAPSGVVLNKDLCSLAQQFFANERPKQQKKVTTTMIRRPAEGRLPERASYQPIGQTLQPEEEEEENFLPDRSRQTSNPANCSVSSSSSSPPSTPSSPSAPLPPTRSSSSQQPRSLIMLKRLQTATKALQS